MNNKYIGIALLLALSFAGGCDRQHLPETTGENISISASVPESKSFIGRSSLNTQGMQVCVVDYLTGFEGTIDGNSGDVVYFDDAVEYGSDANWNFVSGNLWQWTRTGTHNFFGWLQYDVLSGLSSNAYNSGSDVLEFDRTSKTFKIPTIEFTKNSPQFDLCYSDWVSVDAQTRTGNSVALPLNHAFAALSVYITNKSTDVITVKSVQFDNGFKNIKSASYAHGASAITYANQGSSEFLAATYDNPVLGRDTRIDLINGVQISPSTKPSDTILMWPQTEAEVENSHIHMEYTIDGINDPAHPSQLLVMSRDIDLNMTGLETLVAGHKYYVEIVFTDKEIKLEISVKDWEMDYHDASYSESAIVAKSDAEMEGVLWLWNWNPTTRAWDAGPRSRVINLTNGRVQGRFTIASPQEGEWQIDVYPASAAQYYTLSQTSGHIEDLVDTEGVFTGEVRFEINPNSSRTPPATQELHFNVNIRIGGEWRNGNTEFNRKDWKLYLNP